MPLKGEAKREYNRLRQRRLRGYLGKGTGEGVVPGDVVPCLIRENVVPRVGLGATLDGVWMREYQAYLAQRGLTLVLTSKGYELVDVATGEVGVYGQATPWTGLERLEEALASLAGRQQALEQAYVQHQAEHIIHEAPRDYQRYLLEEEGIEEER